ncbi:MAG: anti-sigma factor family protein [Saprospiraceae bacterium]
MEKDFDQYAEQTALFDAYIRGEMPQEQRADFEARLAADEPFRLDFDMHRNLIDSLQRNRERDHWRERLREARQSEPPPAENALRRWWPLALLLVVAIGLFWFWAQSGIASGPNGIAPAVDSLGQTPKKVPTGPVAGGEGGQSERYGANKLEQTTVAMPVLHVDVKSGQKSTVAVTTKATLNIFLSNEAWASGSIQGDLVRVYLPEKQYRRSESYRLVRLNQEGIQTVFLQIGSAFFPLSEADGYLEKTTDEAVLQWLR